MKRLCNDLSLSGFNSGQGSKDTNDQPGCILIHSPHLVLSLQHIAMFA